MNPEPSVHAGIVASHAPQTAITLIQAAAAGAVTIAERTMVEASLDDGQRLLALNELFVGHASHQTARYTLRCPAGEERQASSGIVVTTGILCSARDVCRLALEPQARPEAALA